MTEANQGIASGDAGKSERLPPAVFLNPGFNLNSHGKTPTQTFSFSVRIRPELRLSLSRGSPGQGHWKCLWSG
ncbi:hypothetical protein ETA_11760 [Erwinia tasmaniensis Et1/99]|uniref:Uncharacterized protein n=1 Tax=Erwinia tasmaniensis (strain DSM 17950 / CFBP 7177 / CIP 109463 / NCPPB 4357 / Et1/99) TaxID=465817 RepID=B2VIW2_ERWT9|nr:hypothetical protein ETA_11760 [Erwinia tasmaniensis Et1/99]